MGVHQQRPTDFRGRRPDNPPSTSNVLRQQTSQIQGGSGKNQDTTPSTSNSSRPQPTNGGRNQESPLSRNDDSRLPQRQSQRGRKRTIEDQPLSDDENEYLSASIAAFASNRAKLKELNIVPVPIPKLRTKKTTKKSPAVSGKENRRETLPRAVKSRKSDAPPDYELEPLESESNKPPGEEPEVLGEEQAEQPLDLDKQHQEHQKVSTTKRRKPQITRRRIGQKITPFVPLPPFPKSLQQSINKGLVYVHQRHTQKINDFLKAHILNITKGLYITKREYQVLRTQVVNRLKSMNAPHIPLYKAQLVRKLSASIRNERNYWENKVPKKLALAAEKGATTAETTESSTDDIRTLSAEEADEILRKPVINKLTVKMALDICSEARANFARSHSAWDMIEMYPFLKDTDLLLYDYSTRVPLLLTLIEQNFNESIWPLSIIFKEDEPTDELQKIKLVIGINDYFTDEKDDHFPCIQLWDAQNNSATPLNNIPQTQAPAVVVAVNDKEIMSASVVFDGGCLYSHKRPTAFQSVALLLAGYLVFQVAYPELYKKQLYTLQYILHGQTRCIDASVRSFFRTYKLAKKANKNKE
ncbi:uncharacterized protein LOC117642340 [Thrips palmi]|uniref:Uncharacterized protein LOC117642340 n=1 Tax=Thrips palmi TaxID=161013 RepID=A0A6P8Y9I0_THRPL|nr:uncharacterized protein LOC117642340 [Thrips palmi]